MLDWRPTEELEFYPTVVRLALRQGLPCSTGIVLRATDLVSFTRLGDLLKIKPVKTQDLPSEDLMEMLSLWWLRLCFTICHQVTLDLSV
ncbi:hypothetical protein [Nocardia wallacei]|uniref:hypothetical protein n=1 Tax=Nocardia wallacei TaxID=480035 RepID=UPI0024563C8F|nr:hypothetical protein [Nocardia wallacei]